MYFRSVELQLIRSFSPVVYLPPPSNVQVWSKIDGTGLLIWNTFVQLRVYSLCHRSPTHCPHAVYCLWMSKDQKRNFGIWEGLVDTDGSTKATGKAWFQTDSTHGLEDPEGRNSAWTYLRSPTTIGKYHLVSSLCRKLGSGPPRNHLPCSRHLGCVAALTQIIRYCMAYTTSRARLC